jgi:hypothetical protein
MALIEETEDVRPRELSRQGSYEQEYNTNDNTSGASRERESDRKRAYALVGSALSQLPIWGNRRVLLD